MLHRGLQERVSVVGQSEDYATPHPATCDLCSASIIGVRWKCLNCPDWDCCDRCSTSIDRAHPGHSFVKLHEATDYVVNEVVERRENVKHPNVICDGMCPNHGQ